MNVDKDIDAIDEPYDETMNNTTSDTGNNNDMDNTVDSNDLVNTERLGTIYVEGMRGSSRLV